MIKKQYYKAYPIDKNKLNRNRWMFIKEGLRRGYDIKRIHPRKRIFYVEKNGKGFIYDTLPGSMTVVTRFPYITNKTFQKQIMKANDISVAETFGVAKTMNDLTRMTYKFPCVVKPVVGSRSKNVVININTNDELLESVQEIIKNKSVAIVEQMHTGKEYRTLVIKGKFVSCVQRRPASIVGDDIHTVQELIDIKNLSSNRGPRSSVAYTLHYIVVDDSVIDKLRKDNLTLTSIVEVGRVVFVTTKINTSVGADLVDHTKEIDLSFVQLCENFAKKHNFFIIGFDVIAEDIAKDANKQKYIFNELNEQPFFDISEKCNIGTGAPVAKIMWDEIEKSDIMTKKFLLF